MTQPRRSARLALAALQDTVSDGDSVECMGDDIEIDSVEEPPVEPHCGLCNVPVEISGPSAGTALVCCVMPVHLQCAGLVAISCGVFFGGVPTVFRTGLYSFSASVLRAQCGGPSARLHLVRRAPDDG